MFKIYGLTSPYGLPLNGLSGTVTKSNAVAYRVRLDNGDEVDRVIHDISFFVYYGIVKFLNARIDI